LAVLFTLSITAYGGTAAAQGGAACNRACLINLAKSYVAAVAAHDVSAAPLASNVAFVENVARMKPGEGLWASASSAPKGFAIYVPDVDQQQAGFVGVMERKGQNGTEPVMVAIRLKLQGGKIAEAEHIVAALNAANMARMQTPRPGLLSEVPAANRKSHDELVKIGLSYYDALDDNDGTLMPFADDCQRHENGMISAGPPGTIGMRGNAVMTCKGQYETALRNVVSGIRDRRFVAVDRERGIVFAFAAFDHRNINWTWELGELFKIEGNQIRRIEAIFIRGPYGVCSGWGTYEQCRSEEIQDVR